MSERDLYAAYDVCGRVRAMSAQADQALGGLILWVPVALVDLAAFLFLLRRAVRASDAPLAAQRA